MYDVFSLPDFKFPKDFLWGSSTAGHQIEGDNINSHRWAMENAEGFLDDPTKAKSGKACNHYNMYQEDIELLSNLGHRAFRMSIEWSRIQPEENVFDEEALNHYLHELTLLKEKGVQIFMTIVHLCHPQWFESKGGFSNINNLPYFEKYLEYLVPKITEFVDNWNVFNEFNLSIDPERLKLKFNMLKFHARGYHIIKKYSKAPVSTAHAFVLYHPKRMYDEFDKCMADYYDWAAHKFFLHAIRTGEIVLPFCDATFDSEIKDTVDYWAINIYTRTMIDARRATGIGERYEHKLLKLLPMDFSHEEMYPENLISLLSRIKDKPVYITENGCASHDDRFRIVYLSLYLNALNEAIKMGVDVRGYLYWSLLDNYEWKTFIPRFGLVDVNYENFTRTPKPSAYFYKEIIENNGFSQEILRKYLTELPTREQLLK